MSNPTIPAEAVRAVAEILRAWEVDASGEGDIAPVAEFDAEACELLEAAAPFIAEQGYAIVPATAPQPSDAPRGAQTVDPGISGCPDLPGASTALSDARAALDRVRTLHHVHSCERDGHILSRTPTPCVNDGCCSCGSTSCKTLAALDSPEEP